MRTTRTSSYAAIQRAAKQRAQNARRAAWDEAMDDPNPRPPYGIRWGATDKGSVIHLMNYSPRLDRMTTQCSSSAKGEMRNVNVYLQAKKCTSCWRWMRTRQHTAATQDWNYYTSPTTGRSKRERHG